MRRRGAAPSGCCSSATTVGCPGDVSFRSVEVAWKYKMSEMQAALGRVQLDRIDELIDRKRQIFGWYADRLGGRAVALNVERPDERATYWMVTAVFDEATGVDAGHVAAALADAGIATRPFFPPLSSLPAFADAPRHRSGPAGEPGQLRPRHAGHQPSVGADPRPRTRSTGSATSSGGSAEAPVG